MKKWSITARISLGFALVLGSLCLLTGLSMSRMNAIYNIEHTHLQKELPAASLATEFQRDLLLARIGFIYHVTIQKPGARDQGWQKFKLAQEHLNDLQELVNASGELQESKPFVDKMQRDLAVYTVALGKMMALVDSGVLSGPVYTAQVKDWAAKGAIAVDDADKAEQLYNGKTTASTDATLASLRQTMMRDGMIALAAILGCVALIVSIGRRINRDLRSINAELSNGAGLVGDTSTRLSSAAQHLAEGASQQTASLDQTATAARQVNDSSAKNAEVSKSASEILSIAHRHIEDGNDKLSAMVFSMENIQTSSRQIAKIIQVIDEIAFQTNILALNAAVESAHAGEAGMGFAVVADEVRSLARRTAQAAQETAGLIEQSVRTTSEGSAKLAQLQDSMERITGASQKVRALVTEVSASSREQTHGMDRITGSIRDIEQITRTAAASAQETAAVSQEMDTQSADMRALVARLTALVEGHRGELSPAA